MSPLLQARDLSKTFGRARALRGASLTIGADCWSPGASLATFFLLGAVNLLLIRGTKDTRWAGLVSEEGLRPGTAFALALLVVPMLALVYQAGWVAQATQERRLAALRLAGATPADVRLLGVVEALRVGTVGAVIGGVVYVSGQRLAMAALGVIDTGRCAIPAWPLPVALVLVVAAAAVVSLLVSRHVVVSPLSVARRASGPGRPRTRCSRSPSGRR